MASFQMADIISQKSHNHEEPFLVMIEGEDIDSASVETITKNKKQQLDGVLRKDGQKGLSRVLHDQIGG